MEIERARYLVSADGRATLAEFAALDTADPVRLGAELRRSLGAAEASAVAEQLTLRGRAEARMGAAAAHMLFTSDGLEMMSHPLVAARRAERLGRGLPVFDLTCGLGGDLGPLADAAPIAIGLERDVATAIFAAANVPAAEIVIGDASRAPLKPGLGAVMLDPSRRTARGRTFDPSAFSPAWDECLEVARQARRAVIKGPPGIPPSAVPGEAELEFVQVGRSLREAALWFGEGVVPGLRRAVLLPVGTVLESSDPECEANVVSAGAFLFDPESCVTRAGLVRHLGAVLAARMVDPNVAYLTAEVPAWSPLAATFEVLERVEFSVSRLRGVLRERGWRADEIPAPGVPGGAGRTAPVAGPNRG